MFNPQCHLTITIAIQPQVGALARVDQNAIAYILDPPICTPRQHQRKRVTLPNYERSGTARRL